jgi:hypothetical protein
MQADARGWGGPDRATTYKKRGTLLMFSLFFGWHSLFKFNMFVQLCEYLFEYISTQFPPPRSIQKGEAGSITEFLYFLLHNNMKFNMCVWWCSMTPSRTLVNPTQSLASLHSAKRYVYNIHASLQEEGNSREDYTEMSSLNI